MQLDKEAAVRWQLAGKLNRRDSYIAAGVGGGITGEGADILTIDDPIKDAEEANSQVYRDKVWEWYTTTAYTRLQPNASVILVMTRWAEDDLAGRLIKQADSDPKSDQWVIFHMKALREANERFEYTTKHYQKG